jgi:hypothetical protein
MQKQAADKFDDAVIPDKSHSNSMAVNNKNISVSV